MRDDLGRQLSAVRWIAPVYLCQGAPDERLGRDCATAPIAASVTRRASQTRRAGRHLDRMVRRGRVGASLARASLTTWRLRTNAGDGDSCARYVRVRPPQILPGADDATIEASVRLADRVSVNLEAPNAERLFARSRSKAFATELLASLRQADRIRRKVGPAVSLTTQFVVGAAGETDREILATATALYRDLGLAAPTSAFQPVRDTPLEELSRHTWREQRLYQVDMLLRRYGYCFDELCFNAQGNPAARPIPNRYGPGASQFFPWR